MTTVINCMEEASRRQGLAAAVDALRGGSLVVLPTDTVYGIGADAFNPAAVSALLAAKHRGPDYPVAVLLGSWDDVDPLVEVVDTRMRDLVEAFWPGGVSLIVRQNPQLQWSLGDTFGTVMLRMPNHPVALQLFRLLGPMAVSSANIHGQAPATTCAQAHEQLGESVVVYLDGGESPVGAPSTIIDLTGQQPVIRRQGAVAAADIARVLGVSVESLEPAN